LLQPPKGEVPTVVPTSLRSDSGPFPAASDDPVLAQIASGWADLPEAVIAKDVKVSSKNVLDQVQCILDAIVF
jgi:hypothetical protein